jgi:hypothetical protein
MNKRWRSLLADWREERATKEHKDKKKVVVVDEKGGRNEKEGGMHE